MEKPLSPELALSFPGYRLEKQIGVGGAGCVYLGVAVESGEQVAVKVFHAHLVMRPDFMRRFEREIALSRNLDHPGVVRLLQHVVAKDGKGVALIMEYVPGPTLRMRMKQGRLLTKLALQLGLQIAEILSFVHRKGVAHLDLKPENVLMVDEATVRLMDFGISQATHGQLARDGNKTMSVSGSPHYMAPEQHAATGALDHRADLFALGVILHEMLAGERPVAGVLSMGGCFSEPIQQDAEALVGKLLQMDSAHRYQIAGDVAQKIRQLLDRLDAEERAREAAARIVIDVKKVEASAADPVVQPPGRPGGRTTGRTPVSAAAPGGPAPRPAGKRAQGAAVEVLKALGTLISEHPAILVVLAFFVFLALAYNLVALSFSISRSPVRESPALHRRAAG